MIDEQTHARVVEHEGGGELAVEDLRQACRHLDGSDRVDVDEVDVGRAVAVFDTKILGKHVYHTLPDRRFGKRGLRMCVLGHVVRGAGSGAGVDVRVWRHAAADRNTRSQILKHRNGPFQRIGGHQNLGEDLRIDEAGPATRGGEARRRLLGREGHQTQRSHVVAVSCGHAHPSEWSKCPGGHTDTLGDA